MTSNEINKRVMIESLRSLIKSMSDVRPVYVLGTSEVVARDNSTGKRGRGARIRAAKAKRAKEAV